MNNALCKSEDLRRAFCLREQRGKLCGRLRTTQFDERRGTEKHSFEGTRERGKLCGRLRTAQFDERRDTEKHSFEGTQKRKEQI